MVKVAYIVSRLVHSGPSKQLLNIIKGLDINEFSVIVITLSSETQCTLFDSFIHEGINVVQLNCGRFKGAFMLKRKVMDVLRKYEPDIVHTQGIRPDLIGRNIEKSTMSFQP